MHRTTRPSRRLAALAAVGALALLAACGDDDEGASEPTGTSAGDVSASGAELATYCDAQLEIDQTFQNTEGEDPAELQAAMATVDPIFDEVLDNAPDELDDDLAVLADARAEVLADGGPEAYFAEEVRAADARIHEHDLEACDWQAIELTAEEYAFDGQLAPTAGTVSFELDNAGVEPHVLVVARKKDDVSGTAQEAFESLESEEEMAEAFDVAATAFAQPGDSGYALAELEPGEYLAFCPIPSGEGGPPHFVNGMITPFEVTG